MLQLQHTIGNRGVNQLMGRPAPQTYAQKAPETLLSRQKLPLTPEATYEKIGPLASAYAKKHPAVEAARAKLTEVAEKLKTAPAEKRAELFDKEVVKAEKALAAALKAYLDAAVPPYQKLRFELLGGPGIGSGGGLGTMLKPYADDIEKGQRELQALKRVFSISTAESVKEKYKVEVKPIPGGGCMTAMYKGFEVLYSPAESKALRKKVYKDAKKVLKKTKRDTNNVDRIMATLQSQGRAGAGRKSRYDRRKKTWDPAIESHVMEMITPSIPGWFFFGLSVSGAYHTVTLAVDTTGGSPKIYWLDQFTRGFVKEVTGKLDAKMRAKWLRPGYGYTTSKVWPIIPDPAAAVEIEATE